LRLVLMTGIVWISAGCGQRAPADTGSATQAGRLPAIYPDYGGVTVPPNIAPLRFHVKEKGTRFAVVFDWPDGKGIVVHSRDGVIRIPGRKWSAMLEKCRGQAIRVTVHVKADRSWTAFEPFPVRVAEETIDPYLVYRLIPPGYETWSYMGLFQRDLTSFREKPIIENPNAEENCMNCHSFNKGNSEEMLFHVRGSLGGTLIRKGGTIRKVDLKREETLSAGVYPAWHPSGEYIAFSTNRIEQYFHAGTGRDIEVLDRQSDLILYDTGTGQVNEVPGTGDDRYMETFPCWSPDGSWLYFSRSDADSETPFDSIRYDIYRIAFNTGSGSFQGDPEPVFEASEIGWSASFPRVSPDGRYLLCTVHSYGTFPIWHKEADLCLVDLADGTWRVPQRINSPDTESFHSWSSNNRWIVFSSRREDGRYTRSYISHMDSDGEFSKPFLLPQKAPGNYASMVFSFNRPELITGPVRVPARKWVRTLRGGSQN
jgi:hypothetical protein